MENLNVEPEQYQAILEEIESEESPVGIDAQKAHIIIIQKLLELEERLDRIEEKLEEG